MSQDLFDIRGKRVVVTGGTGVLGGEMVRALAARGARVCLLRRNPDRGNELLAQVRAGGGDIIALGADVLDRSALQAAAEELTQRWGGLDVLVNGAGGNRKDATATATTPFFDLPAEALRWVLDLNAMGTILPSQVFGRLIAQQKAGVILNIASMAGLRPLTNVVAYAAAKAAVANFTQWLAVYMAQNHSPAIRVNAIAPGFFLTEQNRFLLIDETSGELTPRGATIVGHTPMARLGQPADLTGALLWLVSDASAFVTGTVVAVDGGFSAFSGI